MEYAEIIAKRIKILMYERGLNIKNLSKMTGIDQSTISNILNKKCKRPRISTVSRICEALNISLVEFFDNSVFYKVSIKPHDKKDSQ